MNEFPNSPDKDLANKTSELSVSISALPLGKQPVYNERLKQCVTLPDLKRLLDEVNGLILKVNDLHSVGVEQVANVYDLKDFHRSKIELQEFLQSDIAADTDSMIQGCDALGEGGFAKTFASVNSLFAVKQIKDRQRYEENISEGVCRPLDQEFSIAEKAFGILKDEEVASVFVYDLDMTRLQFSMERIDGHDLQQLMYDPMLIYKYNGLDTLDKEQLIEDLITSVKALHRAAICHGDVYPKNLMLTFDLKLVIIDYGLAQDLTTVSNAAALALRDEDILRARASLEEAFEYLG